MVPFAGRFGDILDRGHGVIDRSRLVDAFAGVIDLDLKGMIDVVVARGHVRDPVENPRIGVFLRAPEFELEDEVAPFLYAVPEEPHAPLGFQYARFLVQLKMAGAIMVPSVLRISPVPTRKKRRVAIKD